MYREELMEIYSQKPNFGELKVKTHSATLKNPVCDDEFTLDLLLKDGKIADAKFHGKGCVISTISASVFADKIKGMGFEEAKKLSKKDMDGFLGVEILTTKANCELLPLETLRRIKQINK